MSMTRLHKSIEYGFDIERIVRQAIVDVQQEAQSDYRGAGSLHIWEPYSDDWFEVYHSKIARRAREIAIDEKSKPLVDTPSTNQRHS